MPKHVAVAKALVAGARERRVIGDLVVDAQAVEPAVGQVHLHLTAQQPLRTDGKSVAQDEHPDREHRIDRRSAKMRVVRRQLGMHPGKVQNRSDLAGSVIVRHHLVEENE
jgi:hypothetical protein